jgi:hypothetical protein
VCHKKALDKSYPTPPQDQTMSFNTGGRGGRVKTLTYQTKFIEFHKKVWWIKSFKVIKKLA